MLIGVLPAIPPQSSAHAASSYLADENGQTEITVDVEDEFQVVLYVIDITGVAGYECKITVSGPATPIDTAVHGDWFADGHTIFDGIYPVPADYHTAMLLSPLSISGSGAVVVFTLHADEEGSVAINVDSEYFLFGDKYAQVIEVDLPSTLYVTVGTGGGDSSSSSSSGGSAQEAETTEPPEEALDSYPCVALSVRTDGDFAEGDGAWISVYRDGHSDIYKPAPFEVYGLAENEEITVTADDYSSQGCIFQYWLIDGNQISESTWDFAFSSETPVITAVYDRDWRTLHIEQLGHDEYNWLVVDEVEEYFPYEGYPDENDEIPIEIGDDDNFAGWWLGDPSEGNFISGTSTQVTMQHRDQTLYAAYYVSLDVSSSPAGAQLDIDPAPGQYGYPAGQVVTLTAEATYAGETFHHWTVGGKTQPADMATMSYMLLHMYGTEAVAVYGVDHDYPADFPAKTLQEAIDDERVEQGDTIVVANGTYTGTGYRDLDFGGKAITLRSASGPDNCTIDCENVSGHRGFYFDGGEGPASVVEGFTITRGNVSDFGGGIYCEGSSPTIKNNKICFNEAADCGGGIYLESSELHIIGNTILGNMSGCDDGRDGGGIYAEFGQAGAMHEIIDNTIVNNVGFSAHGGGLRLYNLTGKRVDIKGNDIQFNRANTGAGISIEVGSAECFITGNVIADNSAYPSEDELPTPAQGAGIQAVGRLHLAANTVYANTAYAEDGTGGGIDFFWSGSAFRRTTIEDCIIWGNSAAFGEQIYADDHTRAWITYSDVHEGAAGGIKWGGSHSYFCATSNMDSDPLVKSRGSLNTNGTTDLSDDVVVLGDFHLNSMYGRWDPATEAYVYTDTVKSPCIDTGNPASSYSDEPQPNFGRVNMGAYGNTAEASKSGWNIPGDANDDCRVNILDLIFIRNKLNQPVTTGDNWKADVNEDMRINILDLIYVRSKLNTQCQ